MEKSPDTQYAVYLTKSEIIGLITDLWKARKVHFDKSHPALAQRSKEIQEKLRGYV